MTINAARVNHRTIPTNQILIPNTITQFSVSAWINPSGSFSSRGDILGEGPPSGTFVLTDDGADNVQVYNTSLSSNEVTALYNEGIGGKPIDIQNIVWWWPLNGNAQDYSGNSNDCTATNTLFTSNWESGYTTP